MKREIKQHKLEINWPRAREYFVPNIGLLTKKYAINSLRPSPRIVKSNLYGHMIFYRFHLKKGRMKIIPYKSKLISNQEI